MLEFISVIPWEIALYSAVEYFCGKTDLFAANSLGELVQNVVCKLFKKNHKI